MLCNASIFAKRVLAQEKIHAMFTHNFRPGKVRQLVVIKTGCAAFITWPEDTIHKLSRCNLLTQFA